MINGHPLTDAEMGILADGIRYSPRIVDTETEDGYLSREWQRRDNSRFNPRAQSAQEEHQRQIGAARQAADIRRSDHLRDHVSRRQDKRPQTASGFISVIEDFVSNHPLAILSLVCVCYLMFKLGMAFAGAK